MDFHIFDSLTYLLYRQTQIFEANSTQFKLFAIHSEMTAAQINQNKILNQELFFIAIRKNKPPEEKIKKLTKYLDRGADVNATDANDRRNTPLHVAVLNEELQVVTFLLGKGANDTIKNSDDQTALDIAQLLNSSDSNKIVSILKNNQSGNQIQAKKCKQTNTSGQLKQCNKKTKTTKSNKPDDYQKREGTSGMGGQLFETKVLCLILLRALHDNDIKEFRLASNMAGLGAFDDIVFRYEKQGSQKPRIVFLQTKHKDDPTKDKVTIEEAMKANGNYSLLKYFESYIEVIQKIHPDNTNNMFKGSIENIDCDFILYTPAEENFSKKTIIQQTDETSYIKTSKSGKIFKFNADNEDIEILSQIVVKSRAVDLAKRLSKFLLKGYANMMTDDMIKVYHVYLAHNVISLQVQVVQDNKPNNTHIDGTFRETFLNTDNDLLLLMKNTICEELLKGKNRTGEEKTIKSSFKFPAEFGNTRFHIKESQNNKKKKQDRLNYLCEIFEKLFRKAKQKKTHIVEINESDIGSDKINEADKILKPSDMKSCRLGGLVGNLLIFDQQTKMLKFNLPELLLADDSLNLVKQLTNDGHPLSQYRFDIKITLFPKLSLIQEEDDKILVRDFLSKFKFYTNQAKEDQVENVLKDEIDIICNKKLIDSLKRDAIYLRFHDKMQKWWKESNWITYLTKKCQFFYEAKRDTLDSSPLSILDYICSQKIKDSGIQFKSCAITALKIAIFLEDDSKVMVVGSDEIHFTSIKFIQYFSETKYNSYIFLDLERVINDNYLEMIEKELKDTKCCVLVLIYQIGIATKFQMTFNAIKEAFQGKIILITSNNVSDNLKDNITDKIICQFDNNNSFTDFESEVQTMILEKRELIFQGEKISVGDIFNVELLQAVKPNTIFRLINHETIVIGNTLRTASYKKTVDFYINQRLCRYITLNTTNKENYTDLYFINDYVPADTKPQGDCDIILITEQLERFQHVCNEYEDRNVHWFSREINGGDNIIWLKSKGHLKTLIKYINKGFHIKYQLTPDTLKNKKFIIISGQPGLGKSTLLAHLAVNTKQNHPTLWVSKINFCDLNNIEQFIMWNTKKTNINLVEAFKFLYGAIDVRALDGDAEARKNIIEKICNRMVINNVNEVRLDNVDETVDLTEINLFNHCYNNNQVFLLFDGFDEICPDYTNEVIQLLSTLKSSKVAHLWVTTRPYNVLNQLQCALGKFSFTLQLLTRQEQNLCFQKIWTKEMCCDNEVFLKLLSNARGYDESLMGMPIHIHMIAEIFQQFDESIFRRGKYDGFGAILNPFNLYKEFVKKIFFNIRFGSKKPSMSFKDPDMRKMLNEAHKVFLDNHMKISAHALLNKSIVMELFSKEDVQGVNDFIETVKSGEEKTGIIECIVDGNPKFVHLTYGEYFAMEFIWDKLISGSCTFLLWKSLINEILVTDRIGIRRFIDWKLQCKGQDLPDLISYSNYTDMVQEILSCQSNLLYTLFEVAIYEDLQTTAKFLFECFTISFKLIKDSSQSKIFFNMYFLFDIYIYQGVALWDLHLTIYTHIRKQIKELGLEFEKKYEILNLKKYYNYYFQRYK